MIEKLPALLFCVLLLLVATLAWIWMIPGDGDADTRVHPEFATMQQGGDGEARFAEQHLPVLAWGALSIVLFVGLLLLGAGHHAKAALPLVSVGAVIYLAVFFVLVASYRKYAAAPLEAPIVLGFPTATSWMMYGIWGVPFFFVFLYLRYFDRWVYSADDERKFEELIAKKNASKGAR